jgi:ribosomal subunit interface protein
MTTTMTNLPIHITTHHLSLSESLRRFARKKITPVTRFANDALAAEIVLRRHNGAVKRFSASARLALPGRDVHGRGVDANLYAAIGKLVATLGRRLRKRKTRLAKKFQRADAIQTLVQRPEPSAEPKLLAAAAEDLRKPRFREGGQEMRVFPFRRSVSLGAEIMDGEQLAWPEMARPSLTGRNLLDLNQIGAGRSPAAAFLRQKS